MILTLAGIGILTVGDHGMRGDEKPKRPPLE